jgi:gamma-glutamyltranspeptidase/glutathione hydrolase
MGTKSTALHLCSSAVPSFLVALLVAASTLCVAQAQAPATAKRYMVAAAHPLAVDAGVKVLERGGSAVDAMVAVQLVLNLVEPQSSGLGGGAYLLYYDARRQKLLAYDARETAPADAGPGLFTGADGKPLSFAKARTGGRAVGVPGVPRLLEAAHARHGKLDWAALFTPVIDLAENGFPLPQRLARYAARESLADPAARAWLYDAQGHAKAAGTRVENREFARLLRILAARGAQGFYQGEVARDISRAVREHPNAGTLSEEDLGGYRIRDVDPVCAPYRAWRVCGPGGSTYGGIGVLQILGALERFDMASIRPGSADAVHLITEAARLAYADRNRYGGDDRFTPVPVAGLVDRGYLAERSQLIRRDRSMTAARAGEPRGVPVALGDDLAEEAAGTSHVSIVDAEGNAVALTTTIEGTFGSHVMARGIFLNNELTDFSFTPLEDGRVLANAVAPGKRPRSSMAPVMVFDRGGALLLVAGSPGGSQIINYVARALIAALDWKMDAQRAVALANFGSRNGPTEIERGTELEGVAAALRSMGHEVGAVEMTSGLHLIRRTAAGWEGGADPRRDGVARGR